LKRALKAILAKDKKKRRGREGKTISQRDEGKDEGCGKRQESQRIIGVVMAETSERQKTKRGS